MCPNNKELILALLAAGMLFPSISNAQTLNLQQAVEMSLAADPRIKEREHQVEAARGLLAEVKGKAGVPHETIYDEQPDAFIKDAAGIRSGGAQGEAWSQMLAFLEANLKNKFTQGGGMAVTDYKAPFDWRYYTLLVYEHAFGTASHMHE